MRIFSEDFQKQYEENEIDLKKGHLEPGIYTYIKPEVQEVKGEGHYEVIAEYENGGKEVEWVWDKEEVPYEPAQQIDEDVYVYVLYTDTELKMMGLYEYSAEELEELKKQKWKDNQQIHINNYKECLYNTDYKVIKFLEGWLSQEEFEENKIIRESYRNKIRYLESLTYEQNPDIFDGNVI